MIIIGQKRQAPVKTAIRQKGKGLKFVPKLDAQGQPETKLVANEVTRVTRDGLPGHFCRDKHRRLVVRLCDGDVLELRPQGTRQRVSATLFDIYGWMLRSIADKKRMEVLRKRKDDLAHRRALRRLHRKLRN